MDRVRQILANVIGSKKETNEEISSNEQIIHSADETTSIEVESSLEAKNLIHLIDLALSHPDFMTTEGNLRLTTNEVEKNSALSNLELFFINAEKTPTEPRLLAVLIKNQLKNSLSLEQKRNLILSIGLTEDELNKQHLTDSRMEELSTRLSQRTTIEENLPLHILHLIKFAKEIVAKQASNKMPSSNIAMCLAPMLIPELKNNPEYLHNIVRFEMQLTTLLKLMIKSWIDSKQIELAENYQKDLLPQPESVISKEDLPEIVDTIKEEFEITKEVQEAYEIEQQALDLMLATEFSAINASLELERATLALKHAIGTTDEEYAINSFKHAEQKAMELESEAKAAKKEFEAIREEISLIEHKLRDAENNIKQVLKYSSGPNHS